MFVAGKTLIAMLGAWLDLAAPSAMMGVGVLHRVTRMVRAARQGNGTNGSDAALPLQRQQVWS
ncbi:MAG: hypothetical protein B7X55_11565 [Rhodobacterales bacterium 34-62-10]|nr:MAG: hypothetical protein B7X55_11565 [Rhodobacterales bacterium 34-62-10]